MAPGSSDCAGGLVGRQEGGSITASYATGAANGGDGYYDSVGGLVGWQVDAAHCLLTAVDTRLGAGRAAFSMGLKEI